MSAPFIHENIWADKYKYEEAEKQYFERLAKLLSNNGISYPASKQSTTVTSSPTTFATVTAHGTGTLEKMPSESVVPQPAAAPAGAPPSDSVVDQDKKKKRRKRNSNSNAATSATTGTNVAVPAAQETVVSAVKEEGSDKKIKEKRNEASKKGKKQSPEPTAPKGCSPANPPPLTSGASADNCSLASEVAKARQHIKTSLECVDRISTFTHSTSGADFVNRILSLEKENEGLRKLVEQMQKSQDAFEARLHQLEQKCSSVTSKPAAAPQAKPVSAKDDDDDVDLFGSESEEEDETSKQVREKRLAEYAAKKSKKPTLIAKSNVILDVKPWDDETDMKQLEQAVRDIHMDGLLWGASKLVPLAYGIHKLQISSVVEDEKVSIDLLTESIEEKSDFVQSVDIAAFNKI